MHVLFQLSIAALAVSTTSADHVLVLGKSPNSIWHETRFSPAFSAAGLTDLALNSLGLRTGRISSRSAVQSPLQADIFTQSEVYALLILEDASTSSLEAINVALSDVNVFHEMYPAQACNVEIPVAVAHEFQAKYPLKAQCAGNAALCASVKATTAYESSELVRQVLAANNFLSSSDEHDVAFVKQLAQVIQLTEDVKQHRDGKVLYIVGISSLQGDKQRPAQQVVTTIVTKFLAQLMEKKQVVAGQVMMGRLPTGVQQVAVLSRRARNRKLVSDLTNKEEANGEDENDNKDEESDPEVSGEEASGGEDDELDLEADSGSVWEDDDNSTSTTNSSAPGAVLMPDIAEYQIVLWTSVLLGIVLLGAVLAMANMDAGRDSLLYAKFIADVNGRKTN